MNTQTLNRKAFESVTCALEKINKYHAGRRMEDLEIAELMLENARREDPDYLGAIFYSGMVMDLIARAADASPFFERILRETEDKNVQIEAQFNLAVSYYHRYSHEFLALAEKSFKKVLETTGDETLRNLARANLAQTYAMWMRPSRDQKKDLESEGRRDLVYQHIQSKFDQFIAYNKDVRDAISKCTILGQPNPDMWKRIEATIDNACGMAYMYRTDYPVPGPQNTDALLRESLKCLESAEEKLPSDWANTCDLGSVHLRLGVHQRENTKVRDREFSQAKKLLEKVIKELRPEYGFALYELGILHRVWERWGTALEYFDRAAKVPENYRDINDRSVEVEREKVLHRDSRYP